jgi:hypothetical protein
MALTIDSLNKTRPFATTLGARTRALEPRREHRHCGPAREQGHGYTELCEGLEHHCLLRSLLSQSELAIAPGIKLTNACAHARVHAAPASRRT